LLHLEPLRVAQAQTFPVHLDAGSVDGRGVNQGNRRHSTTSFPIGRERLAASVVPRLVAENSGHVHDLGSGRDIVLGDAEIRDA
jgi:hypothetical protein